MATTYNVCFCYRRRFRPVSSDPPKFIKEVYTKYSGGGAMGKEQLVKFLEEVQGEEEVAARTVAEGVVGGSGGGGRLSVDGFFRYLFGEGNSPLPLNLEAHHQDMTAPMSHYFIYTGHNSYLTGNQLSSDCSEVPIIKALRRGVRAIELDMWPNPTKDDVHILHGRTLTSPVTLLTCLKSIKEHAFAVSPYPVILTLEDHLTPCLQDKVAKMVYEIFGEMLYIPGSESMEELPSPEELKMKIIISTKLPKEYLESKTEHGSQREKDSIEEEDQWGDEVPDLKTFISSDPKDDNDGSYRCQDDEDMEDKDEKSAPEYKRLIAISVRKRKGGLSDFFKVDPNKATRLSVSEQLLEKAVVTHGAEIVRFTEKNLVRVFPKTTRFMSSNCNPLVGWMHGAQMVAFNMQGYGRPLWLMHGMFRSNCGCGYVKKPDFLLKTEENDKIFDPKEILPVKKSLKVRVYMGSGWHIDFHQTHFDTYSPPDFYTRVGIAGVPADTTMKRTRTIEDNWTPTWDEEFTFPLTVPELALLRIEVHEYDMSDKDDFAGQTCLAVSELRPGIRAIPLFDHKGEKLNSTRVLMHLMFV